MVAALQVRHPPAGIVLRSPFTELADVGHTTTPGYRCAPCCATGSRDAAPGHQRRAGHRHLRGPRLSGPHRAHRPRRHAPSSAERLVIVGPTTTTPSCSAHECEGCDSPFQCPSLCCGLAAAWRPPIPPDDLRKNADMDRRRQLHRTSHRPANAAFARSPGRAGDASAFDGVVLSWWGTAARGQPGVGVFSVTAARRSRVTVIPRCRSARRSVLP